MAAVWAIVLLSLQAAVAATATTPLPAWAYSPLGAKNGSFPSLWYGSNQSGLDNPTQLQHDARFSLLFYIWGVGMGQTNWTQQEVMFERQCAAVKATSPERPCLVYLDWATALGWYSVQHGAASDPALDQIWLKDDTGQRLGFTDCHDPNCPEDLMLDFRKAAAVDWWVEEVVEPLLSSKAVDGVFFDSVGLDGGCGGAPTGDLLSSLCGHNATRCGSLLTNEGRRSLFNGTLQALTRVSQLHAAYRKTPVYSLPNYGPFEVFADLQTKPVPGCVEPEEAVVKALEGLPWMRFYEVWPSHNAQTAVAGYCERNVRNALREAALGIPFAVHAFADGQVDPPRCAHASKASDGILRKGWSTGRPLTGANLSGHYPTCVAECAADARCVGITAVVPGGNFSGAGQCELLNSVTQTNTDYRWLSWNKSASSECTCSNVATAAKNPSCEGSALTPQISFSLAAFLTVYSPRYTYYGVSSGYMDGDFPWHKEFDRDYGAPLENATDRGDGSFRRRFEHVTVELNCRTGEASYQWTDDDDDDGNESIHSSWS